MHRLVKFVSDLKSGVPNVTAPVYSHLIYDVIPDGDKTVVQPDILILEGLNVLQSGMDYPHDPHHVFVSDFVDFRYMLMHRKTYFRRGISTVF